MNRTSNMIGHLPADWPLRDLRYVASISLSNVDKKSEPDETSVLLCNYTDVYNNEFISSTLPYMEATATTRQVRKFLLQVRDVIITKDSESWSDIGVPACVSEKVEGLVCGYHLALLRPDSRVMDGRFLLRALQASGVRDQFFVAATGITRYGIGREDISKVQVPTPPLEVQRRLADFLDRKTAAIDALITKKECLIALLEEKRQALITQAVTKGLDPNVPMKDSDVELLGEVPKHWEILMLKRMATMSMGYAFSSETFVSDGTPIVRMSNLRNGRLDLSQAAKVSRDLCASQFALREGDLLVGLSGSLDNFARVTKEDLPCQLNQRVGRIRPLANTKREFLYYLVQASVYQRPLRLLALGTAQANVSPSDILAIKLPLPPAKEQEEIASWLQLADCRIRTAVERMLSSIRLLQEYRQALITAAVTGKIDVSTGATL